MKHVVKNQKKFFDLNAEKSVTSFKDTYLVKDYINRQQIDGLKWISTANKLIDYGSGTGETISLLNSKFPSRKRSIHAVDISKKSLQVAKNNHPSISTEVVRSNKTKQPNNMYDAAMMVHVLHHTHKHVEIFKELHRILKPGGKLMINDLSSNNPIVRLLRRTYPVIPQWIRKKFTDDLSTNEGIPDKYKVEINLVIQQLKSVGFTIERSGNGHLFFFIFCWLDRFVPLSKISTIQKIYTFLISIEKYLIEKTRLSNYAEVIFIYATKT